MDTSGIRDAFRTDWARLAVVEIDAVLAEDAGRLADLTGTRRHSVLWGLLTRVTAEDQ